MGRLVTKIGCPCGCNEEYTPTRWARQSRPQQDHRIPSNDTLNSSRRPLLRTPIVEHRPGTSPLYPVWLKRRHESTNSMNSEFRGSCPGAVSARRSTCKSPGMRATTEITCRDSRCVPVASISRMSPHRTAAPVRLPQMTRGGGPVVDAHPRRCNPPRLIRPRGHRTQKGLQPLVRRRLLRRVLISVGRLLDIPHFLQELANSQRNTAISPTKGYPRMYTVCRDILRPTAPLASPGTRITPLQDLLLLYLGDFSRRLKRRPARALHATSRQRSKRARSLSRTTTIRVDNRWNAVSSRHPVIRGGHIRPRMEPKNDNLLIPTPVRASAVRTAAIDAHQYLQDRYLMNTTSVAGIQNGHRLGPGPVVLPMNARRTFRAAARARRTGPNACTSPSTPAIRQRQRASTSKLANGLGEQEHRSRQAGRRSLMNPNRDHTNQ